MRHAHYYSATAGPSNQGAAMVMGHSEKQWRRWYDMRFSPRLAQQAVDDMQCWRAAMLQIRSGATDGSIAAADRFRLSTALLCRDNEVSDSDSDCGEYQSCNSGSMEDFDIELDLQCDSDID